MSDDDEEDIIDALVGLRFYLSIERDPEDHDLLNIALAEIPRDIVPYVFSRPVSDIVTTTLMGIEMETLYGDDEEGGPEDDDNITI